MRIPNFTPVQKKRVDALLKRIIPPSYDTFNRRYARAVSALQFVKYNDRDEFVYSESDAVAILDIFSSVPVVQKDSPNILDLIREGLKNSRSAAGRKAAARAKHFRRRDADTGKFAIKRKKSLHR